MSVYDIKPERLLQQLAPPTMANPTSAAFCAGFEFEEWRCIPLSRHLIDWLPEYALIEDELDINHGNTYVKLRQAAVRVYTSKKYEKRGEAGEIALHAICRDYFATIPISPRVFYKSATNDVIKAFDMVHVRCLNDLEIELWLGESKLYTNPIRAINDAIASIKLHLDQGFLENQKLLLGPQISKNTPNYEQIINLFKPQSSLDDFISASVFVVGIIANSNSVGLTKINDKKYIENVLAEMKTISQRLEKSGLNSKIKLMLLYIPLGSKSKLVTEFDKRLKGLQ